MSIDQSPESNPSAALSTRLEIDRVCGNFERAWIRGESPQIDVMVQEWGVAP